jgi:hypothetical protein
MTTERKQYTLSEETANFIDCLFMADALYDKLYSTLEKGYGCEFACKVMSEKYSGIHESIRNMINYHLCQSITEKVADGNKSEI